MVDSNVLRDDLIYTTNTETQSALLSAASKGRARLYCGTNVPAEVYEHLPKWVPDPAKLAAAQKIWAKYYLPILRVVEVRENPPLTKEEFLRVEELRARDSDDVPAAILALTLNAPLLTRDRNLLRAVYAAESDYEIRSAWLPSALASRALGEADDFLEAALILSNMVGQATVTSVSVTARALQKMPAPGVVATAIAFCLAVLKSRDRVDQGLRILGRAVLGMSEKVLPLVEDWQRDRSGAAAHLGSVIPYSRPPYELHRFDDATAILARTSMYTLARSAPSSAARLSDLLPNLEVTQGEVKLRSVLRRQPYFHYLPQGRWQLGKPWPPLDE